MKIALPLAAACAVGACADLLGITPATIADGGDADDATLDVQPDVPNGVVGVYCEDAGECPTFVGCCVKSPSMCCVDGGLNTGALVLRCDDFADCVGGLCCLTDAGSACTKVGSCSGIVMCDPDVGGCDAGTCVRSKLLLDGTLTPGDGGYGRCTP